MQTNLEKRLSHLSDPTTPQNLKDRCLNTIPVANAVPIHFQKTVRPFKMQRTVLAGALLFSTVAAVAFWSTWPSSDGTTKSSGSVAFAQVIEASRQVTFFHIKSRLAATQDGKTTLKTSDAYLSESWYDENHGFYTRQVQELLLTSGGNFTLPKGASVYSRNLLLPDGRSYMRAAQATTVYVVPDPGHVRFWKQYKRFLVSQLTGDVEGKTNFAHQTNGSILSSTAGNWKGQKAQILVFEREPNPLKAKHQGARPVQAHFYVNPRTNLVIAEQDFIVSPETDPVLIAEHEFDYTKPKSAIFDAERLTEGAIIRHLDDFKRMEGQVPHPHQGKSNSGS